MKRVSRIVTLVIMVACMPLLTSQPAAAVPTCEVGYTGPNSQNMCTSVTEYSCSIDNTNTVTIVNTNNQQVVSGSVDVSGNTTGGTGTSGSTVNTNFGNFTVTITNPAVVEGTEANRTCVATVVVPAVETPEVVQPTRPTGTGAASTSSPAPIAALPVTSGESSLTTWAVIAAGAVVGTALTVGGLAAYRRFHTS